MNELKKICLEFYRAHTFSILFAACGLMLGILFLIIGFWRTLLLAVLTFGGAFIGRYLDKRKAKEKNTESFDTLYRFDEYRG